MKNVLVLFLLAFSVSLFSQATVIEEWQAHEYNEETGEVETEILVYVVKSGEKTVARFFPEVGKEKEVRKRADDFAKKYKEPIVEKPKNIIRKKEKGNNGNNGNGNGNGKN